MDSRIEVILSPGEFDALRQRDKRDAVCVVFDVLRATSTIVAALANGAECVIPVEDIAEALAIRERRPEVLLAGERNGFRIRAEAAGGVEFDFGNSPREFTAGKVRGRTIVTTTTNGTRALRASAGARAVLASSLLNLGATAAWLEATRPREVLLVCSGTHEEAALEDILAAGALCELVWPHYAGGHVADSAEVARRLWPLFRDDLLGAMAIARNGRRLLSIPELRDDVEFCLRRNVMPFLAELRPDGSVRKAGVR